MKKQKNIEDYRIEAVRVSQQKSAQLIKQYEDLGFSLEGILPGGVGEEGQKYLLIIFKISVNEIEKRARERFQAMEEEVKIGDGITASGSVSYYGLYPDPTDEEKIREYKENAPVKIDMGVNGQLVLAAGSLRIDLIDILKWVYRKMPSIIETMGANYDDCEDGWD